MCKIRVAEEKDIRGVMNIYNKAILETVSTFDTEEKSLEEMKEWFNNHGSKNPIVVAEIKDEIVGWAALSKYSTRCAYSDTAEISLYVKEKDQGKGFGKKLMEFILDNGKKAGLHTVTARITEGNEISVNLHKKFGFEYVGIYKEVGFKFGKRLDAYLMEKMYRS